MAPYIMDSGIGISCNDGYVSGKKSKFSVGERVWAGFHAGGLSGTTKLSIAWWHEENGTYKLDHTNHHTGESGWSEVSICYYIQNYPQGNWRVYFLINDSNYGMEEFTVGEVTQYQYYEVFGTPTGAEIFEGSNFIGISPMSFRLSYNSHTLTFKKSGYKSQSAQVGTKPGGELIKISYTLEEEAPPPLPPPPPEETVSFWMDQGYTNAEATLLATWVQLNQQTPTPAQIEEILAQLEPPLEEPWWHKILEPLGLGWLLDYNIFGNNIKNIYQLIAGRELTEAEWTNLNISAANFFLPLNALAKLFTGKNLDGESEEFGSTDDWMNIILTAVAIVPIGKIAAVTGKIALGKITSTTAAQITSKIGVKATVNQLLAIVRKHPESSAKFLSKFPVKVRNAVIVGLGKNAYGREVIYTLGKTGYFKYSAPAWKRAVNVLFKVSTPLIALTLPIFAITEIPNYLNMRQFARKQMLEQSGDWPGDIAFKLNDYSKLLQNQAYNIDTAIRDGDQNQARVYLDQLKETLTNYINYMEEKRSEMLPEDYDISLEEVAFYHTFITDRETKIGEVEPPEVLVRLRIRVDPFDAKVSVTGQIPTTGEFDKELPSGDYHAVISKFGYLSEERDFTLREGMPIATLVTLRVGEEPPPEPEEKGIITINTTPEGALVEASGLDPKITPTTFEVEAGTYSFVISLEGYKSITRTIFINAGESKTISETLELKEIGRGKILINSEPQGAKIYIDGNYKFVTTPFTTEEDAGTHIVRLELEGYEPKEISLNWEDGQDQETTIALVEEEIPETNLFAVTVKSVPSGAKIIVNGYIATRAGKTLWTPDFVVLQRGTYQITVNKFGYKTPTPVRVVVGG